MREADSMWTHFVSIAIPIMFTVVVSALAAAFLVMRKIGAFTVLFKNFNLHLHSERDGNLKAEGIIYAKNGE